MRGQHHEGGNERPDWIERTNMGSGKVSPDNCEFRSNLFRLMLEIEICPRSGRIFDPARVPPHHCGIRSLLLLTIQGKDTAFPRFSSNRVPLGSGVLPAWIRVPPQLSLASQTPGPPVPSNIYRRSEGLSHTTSLPRPEDQKEWGTQNAASAMFGLSLVIGCSLGSQLAQWVSSPLPPPFFRSIYGSSGRVVRSSFTSPPITSATRSSLCISDFGCCVVFVLALFLRRQPTPAGPELNFPFAEVKL
eukprot:Gb_09151 [translate_table: standard]